MIATTPFRRSSRSRKPTEKATDAIAQGRVEKRRSPRLASLKTNSKHMYTDTPQTHNITYISSFIDDDHDSNDTSSTSSNDNNDEDESDSEDSAFEDSCPSSPEPEEHIALTRDYLEFRAADALDRRESFDSRLDSGNEEYVFDDFIVRDSSEDEVSTAGSEITIQSVSDGSDGEGAVARGKRRLVFEDKARKVARVSEGSSRGRFVPDGEDAGTRTFSRVADITLKVGEGGVEPADVAEEINDAICRYSRRCNRYCPPLWLALSKEVWGDEEVADAVARSVRQGLGTYEEVGDGSGKVLVTVGPLGW